MTSVWKEESPPAACFFFAHCADHIPEQAHRQQPCAQGKADTGCKQQHHHKGDANAARHRQGEKIAPQQAVKCFNQINYQENSLLYF